MPEASVVVLVTSPLERDCLAKIAAVSPRVEVRDIAPLVTAERGKDTGSSERLEAILPDAEVIFGLDVPGDIARKAPRLRWIQVMSAGVDHLMREDLLASGVTMTNIKGMSATPIAEFVIAVALAFVKRLPHCLKLKQDRRWQAYRTASLQSKTIGIVGLGSIGQEVARLARAFGMTVIGTRRTTEEAAPTAEVDHVLRQDQLPRLLANSDFVVLSLPLTTETRGLIAEKELRTMKPTAYLINVARGGIVDEEALIRALEQRWIAGAGLDVFAAEPLRVDSGLWELPNAFFSPHVSGDIEGEFELATDLFIDNLRRYLNDEPLHNVVDTTRGY
jgi:phosphoglycerate dehydrogenase-like enzyme